MSHTIVELEGNSIPLTNLEKLLYPAAGFTKAHVVAYYRSMAAVILPHLRDRALTLKRYPEGVEHEFFFEKRCPSHRPHWVQTGEVVRSSGETLHACLVNDAATLLWVANLASLELHVPLARVSSPGTPDALVFDLDPGEPADILDAARVALLLKELLGRLQLVSLVKTSGQKGLHVLVPLYTPAATFVATKEFSRTVALILEKNYPELVTAKMAREARHGRVFINWSQNDPSLTMVCVYSLRGQEKPSVSFPIKWQQLEQAVAAGTAGSLPVLAPEAMLRAKEGGDLFRELLEKRQQLPHL